MYAPLLIETVSFNDDILNSLNLYVFIISFISHRFITNNIVINEGGIPTTYCFTFSRVGVFTADNMLCLYEKRVIH